MRAKAIAAILAATAYAALLLSPGAAIAHPKPASRQRPPSIVQTLELRGSNGFAVEVTVDDRRRLTLTAGRFGRMLESASYTLRTHPRRGSDDIVARLGRFGRIDVRFVPRKVKEKKPPRACRGGKLIAEEGHFVGLMAFRGERGYTRVRAHRAAGTVSRTPALTCRRASAPGERKRNRREQEKADEELEKAEGGEGGGEKIRSVDLFVVSNAPRVVLVASRISIPEEGGKGESLTSLVVAATRRRGRIRENNLVGDLFDGGSTFRFPNQRPATSELVLEPSAPFSGSGTFRRNAPQPPTWTGDLKVDFPGFGPVRLVGPGTRASMCEGVACLLHHGEPGQNLLRRLAS